MSIFASSCAGGSAGTIGSSVQAVMNKDIKPAYKILVFMVAMF
jgi:hypothetical protein